MVNYQNGKIYKIINENDEIVYIGSTAQKLCRRYNAHKHKAPNHKIILIENYSCNSKEELCKKEQQIIEEHSDLFNKQRAYISEEQKEKYKKEFNKQYRKNNKEYYKEYHKKYHENNKNELNEKHKEWYENNKNILNEKRRININCEFCNCEINKGNLKRHQKTKKCLEIQDIITK